MRGTVFPVLREYRPVEPSALVLTPRSSDVQAFCGGQESFNFPGACEGRQGQADGPLRQPYTAYFQGGLTYSHAKYGILRALDRLVEKDLVRLP